MKIKWIGKQLVRSTLYAAIGYFMFSTIKADAQQVKGGQRVMQLAALNTVADIQKVQEGDMIVMSCRKCKSAWIREVQSVGKGGRTDAVNVERHECPGCEVKITVKGIGKAGKKIVKHVCKECGSKDAFCCAIKKGSAPTLGMENQHDANH